MEIVIAHPAALTRDLLELTFAGVPDMCIRAVVSTIEDLRRCCRRDAPRVVVAAAVFPEASLGEALPELLSSSARLLVVCGAEESDAAHRILFAGASGCLFLDDATLDELVTAVRDVAEGQAALHPSVAAAVLNLWRATRDAWPDVARTAAPNLTPRERQVLEALAGGRSTRLVGRDLAVSPKTVEAHVGRVLTKLGARNRAHAVSIALSWGLISDSSRIAENEEGPNR